MRGLRPLAHLHRLPEVWRCFRQACNPLAIMTRYLQVGSDGYPFHLELRNGISLVLDDFHDLVTAWVVFFRNEYEIPPGARTVIDLGANIGCFSLRAAYELPLAQVIAVEPFPTTVDRLVGHVRQTAFRERIRIWKLAVASGSQRRWMPAAGPGPSRGLVGPGTDFRELVEVSTISLAEVLSRACTEFGTEIIDLLKMDIEGAEHEAVLSTPPPALRGIRHLAMEYHPNESKRRLFKHLSAAGLCLDHDRKLGPNVGIAHFRRI